MPGRVGQRLPRATGSPALGRRAPKEPQISLGEGLADRTTGPLIPLSDQPQLPAWQRSSGMIRSSRRRGDSLRRSGCIYVSKMMYICPKDAGNWKTPRNPPTTRWVTDFVLRGHPIHVGKKSDAGESLSEQVGDWRSRSALNARTQPVKLNENATGRVRLNRAWSNLT